MRFSTKAAGTTDVAGDVYLGYHEDSVASYTLRGGLPATPTTLCVDGTLYVGYDGTGELAINSSYCQVNGDGRMIVAAGTGTFNGGGSIYVPVTNHGNLTVPENHMLSMFADLTNEPTGTVTTASWGMLQIYNGATFNGPCGQ